MFNGSTKVGHFRRRHSLKRNSCVLQLCSLFYLSVAEVEMAEGVKETRIVHRGIPRLKTAVKTAVHRTEEPESVTDVCKQQSGTTSKSPETSLSLQGPFNPDIVANARKQEDKRKRGDGSRLLPAVRSLEDLACKRNQALERDKLKYQRHFSGKPDTKFTTDDKRPLQFTAKGPLVPGKTKG